MAALNNTTFDAALKIQYRQGIEHAALEKSTFLGVVEKRVSPGLQYNMVLDIEHTGASPSFVAAQSRAAAATKRVFAVTRAKCYVFGSMSSETLDAGANGGAVADPFADYMEEKLTEAAHAMSYSVWQGQGGAVGKISTVVTTRITLTNVEDHVHFNVGDFLEFSTTNDSASTPHSSGATAKITAIDRVNGFLDTGTNWATQVSAIAASDFIFNEGWTGQNTAGVLAWVPPDTTPPVLFGLTRTTDNVRLAGYPLDVSSLDPISALLTAKGKFWVNAKVQPDITWMNPTEFTQLEIALEGKTVPTRVQGSTLSGIKIGYDAISYGGMSIMQDVFCPVGYALMTRKSGVWKLAHTRSGLFHFHDSDGNKLSRQANADADEFRIKSYYQMECHKPWCNVLLSYNSGGIT